jgi:outer membrane protein assembly factor BamB
VGASSSTDTTTVVTQLWRFPTTGSVYGSPLVSNGYVYAVSSFIQSSIGYAYCFNASTGIQIWNYTIDTYYYGSLCLLDGTVYIVSTKDSTLHALNPYTGIEEWKHEIPYEYASYPSVADDRVFVTGSISEIGSIYCLDASQGTQIWNHTLHGNLAAPIIAENRVYVVYSHEPTITNMPRIFAGGVYVLDASTGRELWNYTLGSPYYLVVASDIVFITTSDYTVHHHSWEYVQTSAYQASVYALNVSTGARIWNYTIGGYTAYLAIANGFVYTGARDGNLYAFDALSGKKMWNYTLGELAGVPLIVNGYIYASSSGSVYCLDASTGRKIWNYKTEDTFTSSPIVVDGQVYVGAIGSQFFASLTHHNVYALDAISGEKIWNYTIEGNAHSLAVAGGVVYVGSSQATKESPDYEGNGAVYALKPTVASPSSSLMPFTDLQLLVIGVVVSVVILAVVFLVYRTKIKGVKRSPPALSLS